MAEFRHVPPPPEDEPEPQEPEEDEVVIPAAAPVAPSGPRAQGISATQVQTRIAGEKGDISAAVAGLMRGGPEPRRRPVDEAVLAVLRDEAERETRARQTETAAAQPQRADLRQMVPETALQTAPQPHVQTMPQPSFLAVAPGSAVPQRDPVPEEVASLAARMITPTLGIGSDPVLASAPFRETPRPFADTPPVRAFPDHLPSHGPQRVPRQDVLPDIEGIGSTLKADINPEQADRPAGGFRAGFLGVLMGAGVLAGVYAAAPVIGREVPMAGPVMLSYVATVDAGRRELDAAIRGLAEIVSDATAQITSNE